MINPSEDADMNIGFLGVGNMGQPMAGKLLDVGHTLTVHDVNEANVAPLLARPGRRR
jgi:3-hydroxyisobutyrate dehydrogenase-like beta-hydroxyacid dehydrogenase